MTSSTPTASSASPRRPARRSSDVAALGSATVRHVLAPLVVGADPFDTLPLWERMYARLRDYGQKGIAPTTSGARTWRTVAALGSGGP